MAEKEPNKEAKNCWEFWDCALEVRRECPAYQSSSGTECWFVAGSYAADACPKLEKKYKYCWDCPWFQKFNPNFHKKK